MVDRGRGTDKLDFRYKSLPRWTSDGKSTHIRKPAIEVTFRLASEAKSVDNREVRINALIDSGADWSFLPLEIANTLRLPIDTSEAKILTISGTTPVYTSKVYVEIPRHANTPVPVGFVNVHIMPKEVDDKQMPNFVILGRKDFFEKFEVTINETAQHITLRDVHKDQTKKHRF